MHFHNYYYFFSILTLLVIFLLFSFKRDLKIGQKLKYMVPALIVSDALLIMFGFRFVELKVWQFNPEYLINFYLYNLPVEEWLYYIVLSLNGFLIYEIVKIQFSKFNKANFFVALSLFLFVVFVSTTYLYRQLIYTFVIFVFLTVYFGYTIFRNRFKPYYSKFYPAFLLSLIPFFILNIISTGLPVINYNEEYILGIRLFTIPIENLAVFFFLFLMNISIYEYLFEKRFF